MMTVTDLASSPMPTCCRASGALGIRSTSISTTRLAPTSLIRDKMAGIGDAFDFPGVVPEYVRPLSCDRARPSGWAAWPGDPDDIRVSRRGGDGPMLPARSASPEYWLTCTPQDTGARARGQMDLMRRPRGVRLP